MQNFFDPSAQDASKQWRERKVIVFQKADRAYRSRTWLG
jgi:hypothetical protein